MVSYRLAFQLDGSSIREILAESLVLKVDMGSGAFQVVPAILGV